ncbi:MAG: 50S ribosomal protein L11 methyltransferase [Prevotellaceae bacterium]|jgi:ribosomal protein L11 methyltransferase|nr:50S ribosomal protein L11 methyltransferase [Prevotellaceae bacterium]
MDYIEVHFYIEPDEEFLSDALAGMLSEIDFESFIPNGAGIDAYIQKKYFDERKIKDIIDLFPFTASIVYKTSYIESKDWNEEWEKNYFDPIVIGNECVIHSPFHKKTPKARYDIVINPKMAFGTGHHETTGLMIEYLLLADLKNKETLDMGCGTSVLAILAKMRGAKQVTAIDIDAWCVDNALENIALNNQNNIEVKAGDADLLRNRHFDVILANINRNVLLKDMRKYAACLPEYGDLYMSGFYKEDMLKIEIEARKHQLLLKGYREKNNWAAVRFVKEKLRK